MFGKLLASVFSFFAVIAAGPLIVIIAVFVFKFDIRSFTDNHSLATSLIAAVYAFIWVMAYFGLQDHFIVWKPEPGVAPISKTEMIDRLERSFKKPFEGNTLFDVFQSEDGRMAITWSSSIKYFQIISGGEIKKKRVVVLTFDKNKHEAYFIVKEKDLKWSLSKNRFDFSMNFSAGIFAEISTEIVPSVTIDSNGNFSLEVKKLKYDYKELWLPIENTLLKGGWTIRGGMLPKLSHRLALALPLALLIFFLFFCFPSKNGTSSTPQVEPRTAEHEPRITDRAAEPDKSTVTSNLEFSLDGLMKVPNEYFENYRSDFIAYSRAYIEKTDKDPKFVARIKKFAKKHNIDL